MQNYRRRTLKKEDRREGGWIRIPHPIYQGNSDKDVRKWTDALGALQMSNPELYAKVIHQHLVVDPIKYRKDWLDLKYPPVKPEPEIV